MSDIVSIEDMNSKRNIGIDLLRVLSVFYIVGIWHMINYTTVQWGLTQSFLGDRLTNIILGTFVFISGYFLGTKQVQLTITSLWDFYTKRFLRLYPLYILALVVFYVFSINGIVASAKAFFLSSMLVQPAPTTLWFISMILLLSILAPFFMAIYRNTNPWQFWLFVGILLSSLYGYHQLTSNLDVRLILYLPTFLLGLIVAEKGLSKKLNVTAAVLFVSGLIVTLSTYTSFRIGKDDTFVTQIPFVLGGSVLLFWLFSSLSIQNNKAVKAISLLSYASYCTYLFHRIIFTLLERIYIPSQPIVQLFYLSIVGFTLSAVLGYTIQFIYDRVILRKEKLAV